MHLNKNVIGWRIDLYKKLKFYNSIKNNANLFKLIYQLYNIESVFCNFK